MYSSKNYISLSFRADDEDTRDTDLNVNIDVENVSDAKLCKTLNRWLKAIEADLVVGPAKDQ
jgi:hypothetical protein